MSSEQDPVKNESSAIQFAGFRDTAGVREFSFDLIAADHSRTRLIVSADMSLARKYNIRLQELPLLCRRLLDDLREEQVGALPISLTEQHMVTVEATAQAGAEKNDRKRKPVAEEWTPFNSHVGPVD